MINFKKHTLPNGLTVIIHENHSTPMAAMNILYNVGARDEHPDRTGFAHLFEHLMFGGSANIPNYDKPLQEAGGENNAFTSNDITNYYLTLPANNLETAFWLESDRMNALDFSPKSLEVQRNVVTEEFNERYFSQPYGDLFLLLRPHAYKVHPYQWATIGKEISHISGATLEEVRVFFYQFYLPSNAIMCVAGNVKEKEVMEMSEKWFGPIPGGSRIQRNLPKEPKVEARRILEVERDVPFDLLIKAYHGSPKNSPGFYAEDLLTDIMSEGNSSRFYQELVLNKELFIEADLYLTGEIDGGLIVAEGKLRPGVSFEEAERAIDYELEKIMTSGPSEEELEKVKNKVVSTLRFSEMNVLNNAMNLCFSELLGDAGWVNDEESKYAAVTAGKIKETASKVFSTQFPSVINYKAKR